MQATILRRTPWVYRSSLTSLTLWLKKLTPPSTHIPHSTTKCGRFAPTSRTTRMSLSSTTFQLRRRAKTLDSDATPRRQLVQCTPPTKPARCPHPVCPIILELISRKSSRRRLLSIARAGACRQLLRNSHPPLNEGIHGEETS